MLRVLDFAIIIFFIVYFQIEIYDLNYFHYIFDRRALEVFDLYLLDNYFKKLIGHLNITLTCNQYSRNVVEWMKDQIAYHEGVMPYIKTGRNELHKFEGQYFHSIHSIFDCLLPPKETFRSFLSIIMLSNWVNMQICQSCTSFMHIEILWIFRDNLKFLWYCHNDKIQNW